VLPNFQTAFILNVNSKDIYFERLLSVLIHLMSLLHIKVFPQKSYWQIFRMLVCLCVCLSL